MPRGVDRYDEARLQGRLWTPQVLRGSNKLGMWFDAADLSTLTFAGSLVSQWSDKSGNAYHATQPLPANQPSYNQSLITAGLPSLGFAGAPDNLAVPNINSLGLTSIEALYVCKANADPAGGSDPVRGCVLGTWGTHPDGDHEPFSDGTVYHGFCATARKTVGNLTPSLAVPRITGIRSAANDWQYWIDGAQMFSTATNTVAFNTVSAGRSPTIGLSANTLGASYGYVGQIGEVVVCFAALTTGQRQALEGYLAWKWRLLANLPASHPYKNRPPLIGD